MSSSIESDNDSQLANLYEEYEKRRQNGDAVSPSEFAALHPEYGEELLELIQTAALGHAPKSEHSIPDKIFKYELKSVIGRGGMGVVYRARHADLNREIALKVIPRMLAVDERYALRFKREAKSASGLDHPHIVRVFDYGIQEDIHWLAMPIVEGQDLSQIDREDLVGAGDTWTQIAKLGAQAASALSHAHENGVIHRDIKPSNLLLDKDNKVRVTDFGLAKVSSTSKDLSSTDDVIGTPRYMAPEQLRGRADARTDIYSLGVTLWALASRQQPWDSSESMVRSKSTVGLPLVRDIDPAIPVHLANIIDRACAAESSDRFQTAQEFQYALNRFAHRRTGADRRTLGVASLTTYLTPLLGFVFLLVLATLLANGNRGSASTATRFPKGAVHVKQLTTGRYLSQVRDGKNVETRSNPEPWQIIQLGTTSDGLGVVRIRNLRTGKHLDFDDSDFDVDVSSDVDEDSQWKLIPSENGTFLIRNRELGAYLHDEGDSTNYNVNGAPKPDADCFWQVVESEVEQFKKPTGAGKD